MLLGRLPLFRDLCHACGEDRQRIVLGAGCMLTGRTICAVARDMSQMGVHVRPQWGPLSTCWQKRLFLKHQKNCREQILEALQSVINWH